MPYKSVHLCLSFSESWNREVLPGIARYARQQGDWNLVSYPHLPDPDRSESPDGLIPAGHLPPRPARPRPA